MFSETKKLLEQFATQANWGTLGNPVDMERFWNFVIAAYRNNEQNISLAEFLRAVGAPKISKEAGRDIKFFNKRKELSAKMFMFHKYEDGIKLLHQFEKK